MAPCRGMASLEWCSSVARRRRRRRARSWRRRRPSRCRWPATISICRRWPRPSSASCRRYEKSAATLAGTTTTARDYAARALRPLLAFAKADDRAHLCGALQYTMKWLRVGSEHVLFTAYHTPTVRGSLTQGRHLSLAALSPPQGRRRQADDGADPRRRPGRPRARAGVAGRSPTTRWRCMSRARAWSRCPTGASFPSAPTGTTGRPIRTCRSCCIADKQLPPGPAPPSHAPGNPKARAYFAAHPARPRRLLGAQPALRVLSQRGEGGRRQVRRARRRALGRRRRIARADGRAPLRARAEADRRRRRHHRLAADDARSCSAQDTGAGIRGQRMDVYFGEDDVALAAAQAMTVQGDAWVLMPK